MAEKSVSTESLGMEKTKAYTGKKLRIAYIGCGGIAQTHFKALETFPDVEIVAGVDIDPDRLTVMKDKWNVHDVFKEWKSMLKEIKPDAVVVCTPNGVHAQPSIDS